MAIGIRAGVGHDALRGVEAQRQRCRREPGRGDPLQQVPTRLGEHQRAIAIDRVAMKARRQIVDELAIDHSCTHDSLLQTRSEEHTSELQSLMRISYAVFCLTKNKSTKHYTTNIQAI